MTTTPEKTHICMVLDRSGSMNDCRSETVASVNNYLTEAKADAALADANFELMIFDKKSIDTIRDGKVADVALLTDDDFVPRDWTPLFDAIGRGVDNLDAKLRALGTKKAVLVVVTDGQENSSRKHTHATISEVIQGRQASGWLVIFLGAGLEAASQGISLGIRAATVASFAKDAASLQGVSSSVRGMSSGYGATMDFAEALSFAADASFSEEDRAAMDKDAAGSVFQSTSPLGGAVQAKNLKSAVTTKAQAKVDTWTGSDKGDAWKQ